MKQKKVIPFKRKQKYTKLWSGLVALACVIGAPSVWAMVNNHQQTVVSIKENHLKPVQSNQPVQQSKTVATQSSVKASTQTQNTPVAQPVTKTSTPTDTKSDQQASSGDTIWKVNANLPYDVTIGGGHYYGVDGEKLEQLDGGTKKILADVNSVDTGGCDPHTFMSGHIAYDNGDIYWGGLLWKPSDNAGAGEAFNIIMRYHNGQLTRIYYGPAFWQVDYGDPNVYVNPDNDTRLVNYNGNIVYNYVQNNDVPDVTVDGDNLYVAMMGLNPNDPNEKHGSWEGIYRINKYSGQATPLVYGQGLGVISKKDSPLADWFENGFNIEILPKPGHLWVSDGNFRIYDLDESTNTLSVKYDWTHVYQGMLLHPTIYNGNFYYAGSSGVGVLKDDGNLDQLYTASQFPSVQTVKDFAMDDTGLLIADPDGHQFIYEKRP